MWGLCQLDRLLTGDSETPVTAWHLSQIDRLLSDDSVGKGCAVLIG